jgi:hypothetical protein
MSDQILIKGAAVFDSANGESVLETGLALIV